MKTLVTAILSIACLITNAQTIPFKLNGSRIYLQGLLNEKEQVEIQFDLGAGTNCVNKMYSQKLNLLFNSTVIVNNTEGVHEARTSTTNKLSIASLQFDSIPFTEVGNMRDYEDVIIGNGLFLDKVIEIDYDKKVFIVHEQLPRYAKKYTKLPVIYVQNRPKIKASFVQNGIEYWFWILFDTGRTGTMLIGEDFTGQDNNWQNLKELTILDDGRKIVRLDATIAGVVFKDIVTNAADPAKPRGRNTLFGNQILNHFNFILDNIHGQLYLKPNGRSNEPYANYKENEAEMKKPKQ